jgi:hypothetical protein
MRLMFLMISLALIALGITACAGSVQVVSASSDAVMLKHTADSSGAAAREAENLCGNYSKKARFRTSHDDMGGGQRQSIYDCVPR